ncbi:hypothetical protein MTBSS4_280042 [Magnetospirillum sp. SS-4]|nr:hypothetical protein MTBSS4_280042 [Magnetospirillum sp. SS-4]
MILIIFKFETLTMLQAELEHIGSKRF